MQVNGAIQMSADLRTPLAAQQAALVRALAGLEPCPDGFDLQRVASASDALAMKRSRAAAKIWPDLCHAIGDHFNQLFADYAQEYPTPPAAGPGFDCYRFGQFLASHELLTDKARQIWLAMRLRYRCTETGLNKRRGLTVVWDRRPGTFQIRIRVGWSSLFR